MKLLNAQHASEWRLCVGCGACSYVCPEGNISLENVRSDGIRPRCDSSRCRQCGECLKVCPGVSVSHAREPEARGVIPDLSTSWGPVLEVWEGHAVDTDIRFQGSSGGLASALSLYCIEKAGMPGALHVGPHEKRPLENRTVFSTSRDQILARTGSRYSPASPCDGLGRMEEAERPCVFIGKPCDVAALRKAEELRPGLRDKVGAAIGIFCAGTPSLQGTLDLLEKMGIDPDSVQELRYRGRGWPGKFAVRLRGGMSLHELTTYMDAWGFVQKYRPYRCYLCPDSTSEFADISCGDPWYRKPDADEPGRSMVLVRTEKGRRIVQGALEAGYVKLEKADPAILPESQRDMPAKRGAIWGRLLALRSFGIPAPKLEGFSLYRNWQGLSPRDKARSILGTARRIVARGYYRTAGR